MPTPMGNGTWTDDLLAGNDAMREQDALAQAQALDQSLGATQAVPPTPNQLLMPAIAGGIPQAAPGIGPQGQIIAPKPTPAMTGMQTLQDQAAGKVPLADIKGPPPPVPMPAPAAPTIDPKALSFVQKPTGSGSSAFGGMAGAGGYKDPFADYYKTRQGEVRAINDVARADQHINDDAAGAAWLKGQELGNQKTDVLADADKQDADYKAQLAKMDQLSKDAASEKIDPDRWYHSRSTAQKIAWGIAAMFDGFVSGMHGGANQAFEMMNRESEKDINEQAREIEAKKGRIGDMRGILAETYKRYGNMDQAKSAARILTLQQRDEEAKSYAVGSQDERIQAAADLSSAQIQSEIAKEKALMAARSMGGGASLAKLIMERTEKIEDQAMTLGIKLSAGEAQARAVADVTGRPYDQPGLAKDTEGQGKTPVLGQGEAPPSTSPWEHPVDYLTNKLGIRGTEGYEKGLAQDTANLPLHGFAHQAYGIRNPEDQERTMGRLTIQPGDSDKVIAQKWRAQQSLNKNAPKGGSDKPSGFVPDDEDE